MASQQETTDLKAKIATLEAKISTLEAKIEQYEDSLSRATTEERKELLEKMILAARQTLVHDLDQKTKLAPAPTAPGKIYIYPLPNPPPPLYPNHTIPFVR
jgi:predicted RNase H-like nuclease (RuvC/YqgF family)